MVGGNENLSNWMAMGSEDWVAMAGELRPRPRFTHVLKFQTRWVNFGRNRLEITAGNNKTHCTRLQVHKYIKITHRVLVIQ